MSLIRGCITLLQITEYVTFITVLVINVPIFLCCV